MDKFQRTRFVKHPAEQVRDVAVMIMNKVPESDVRAKVNKTIQGFDLLGSEIRDARSVLTGLLHYFYSKKEGK